MDSMPAFTSSSSRLLIDVHRDMVSAAYPCVSSTVLNENFLSILSTQLTKCDTSQDEQLCVMALNILSWILSFVSCSDDEKESNIQKKLIIESSHLKSSFERTIVLISSHYDNVEVVNLCLFVLTEQSTPHLVVGRSAALVDALVKCMDHNNVLPKNIPKNIPPKNIPVQNERWKQPIIACSALCVLLDQIPDEMLKRHQSWSAEVFLLLVQSFSPNTAQTQVNYSNNNNSSNNNSSNSSSSNNNNNNNSSNNNNNNSSSSHRCSGDVSCIKSNTLNTHNTHAAPAPDHHSDIDTSSLALNGFSADPDSRLLPLSVSTLRILGQLTPGQCTPLVALALCSYSTAMTHLW
jgi:hypothetical protein